MSATCTSARYTVDLPRPTNFLHKPSSVKLQYRFNICGTNAVLFRDISLENDVELCSTLAFLARRQPCIHKMRSGLHYGIEWDLHNTSLIIETWGHSHFDIHTFETWKGQVFDHVKEYGRKLRYRFATYEEEVFHYIVLHVDGILAQHRRLLAFLNDTLYQIEFVYPRDEATYVEALVRKLQGRSVYVYQGTLGNTTDRLVLLASWRKLQDTACDIEYKDGELVIRGLELDVKLVEEKINAFRENVVTKTHQVSKEVATLLGNQGAVVYVRDRIRQSLGGTEPPLWEVSTTGGYIHLVSETSVLVENLISLIDECFQRWTSEPVAPVAFQAPAWFRCLRFLGTNFPGKIHQSYETSNGCIAVTSTQDVFYCVSELIKCFLIPYKLETRSLSLGPLKTPFVLQCMKDELEREFSRESLELKAGSSSTAVLVRSTEYGYTKLTTRLEAVVSCRYGLTDERLLGHFIPGGTMLENVPVLFEMHRNTTQLKLVPSRIEEVKVDVVINSTSPDVTVVFAPGTAAKAIMDKAGEEATTDLLTKYPDGIECGKVAVSKAGNLPCKEIYHVTLKHFEETGGSTQLLRQTVRSCLEVASEARHTSIAFPALCVGTLHYAPEMVADAMFDVIIEFINAINTTLMDIIITILPARTEIWEAFQAEEARRRNILLDYGRMKTSIVKHSPYPLAWYLDVVTDGHDNLREAKQRLVDLMYKTSPLE